MTDSQFIEVVCEDGYSRLLNRSDIIEVAESSRREAMVRMRGEGENWLLLRMSFEGFKRLLAQGTQQ